MGLFRRAMDCVKQSDIVLEILDARLPEQTRNRDLEQKILRHNKKLVFVLNKSDLVSKKISEANKKELEKTAPAVFVSATKKKGVGRLRKMLREIAKNKKTLIGIIGYPNCGKSSVLNALAGRKAARTSSQAGFTRGIQLVRISEEQFLLDSPGIIPFEQRNEFELALVSSKNPNQLHDKEGVALQLAEWIHGQNPEALLKAYGLEWTDSEDFLEQLAKKKGRLIKGGKTDWNTVSTFLILDWQRGKIRI